MVSASIYATGAQNMSKCATSCPISRPNCIFALCSILRKCATRLLMASLLPPACEIFLLSLRGSRSTTAICRSAMWANRIGIKHLLDYAKSAWTGIYQKRLLASARNAQFRITRQTLWTKSKLPTQSSKRQPALTP